MGSIKKYEPKGRRWNLRPRVQVNKIYWEFHKGDADFNPSVPHGHSLEGKSLDGKYKLELWSGKIYYQSTSELIGIAKPKDMLRLYHSDCFQDFVIECRAEYAENNPHMQLPPLTDNPCIARSRAVVIRRYGGRWRRKQFDSFVFATEYEVKK